MSGDQTYATVESVTTARVYRRELNRRLDAGEIDFVLDEDGMPKMIVKEVTS